jgi:hypothetical protein
MCQTCGTHGRNEDTAIDSYIMHVLNGFKEEKNVVIV